MASITAEDLLELVEYTELGDGRWKAKLDAGTGGNLSLTGSTLQGASTAMRDLCKTLAAKLEVQRQDARKTDRLSRRIFSETQTKN